MTSAHRLYVVAEYHHHFVHWCATRGLSPHLNSLVELSEGSHWPRRLHGVRAPRFTVASLGQSMNGAQLLNELLFRYQGNWLTGQELDDWVATQKADYAG